MARTPPLMVCFGNMRVPAELTRTRAAKAVLLKCGSWPEFQRALASASPNLKGDCFELLSLWFLRLDPTYRSIVRHVWSVAEGTVPASVQALLNLPATDEGIDLIVETHEGKFWAVQCKYREDDHSLTLGELATFATLAFVNCRNVELGLVCSTAGRYSGKLAKYAGKLSFCAGDVWSGLTADFWQQLHAALLGKSLPRPAPHQSRADQRAGIEAAAQHFDTSARGKLLMPCGTGKSLTAFWIAQRLRSRSILVAVPSLNLVRQTLQVWMRECVALGRDAKWLVACSDQSVSDELDAAVHVADLGIAVHTNPGTIEGWLRSRSLGELTIVFTTYQSGPAVSQAARAAGFQFDLGIFDEAHRTVGRKQSRFAHLLDDENITVARRIFMTATERRYAGTSDDILSMDSVATYGGTFHHLSFKAAPPILSDYRIVTICVLRSEVEHLVSARSFVRPEGPQWSREVEANILAAAIALRRALQKFEIRRAVSFHSSVQRARQFAELQNTLSEVFPKFGALDTFHVSGKTPTAARGRALQRFAESERALVTNARCLTEGIDVPGIDCVLFADPRHSVVDIVQATGRALRKAPGKRLGYVVVPVLLDDSSAQSGIGGAFAQVLKIVRALAANDERIVEYFRSISSAKAWARHPLIEWELPVGLKVDASEFEKAVDLNLWKAVARISIRPFAEARDFVRKLGLRSQHEWTRYARSPDRPADIPYDPRQAYLSAGWSGYGDWLGTDRIASAYKQYRPFSEAREFARSLRLSSSTDWKDYVRSTGLPDDIPTNVWRTYSEEWQGWGDFLGTGVVSNSVKSQRFLLFDQARAFARSLGLKSGEEWSAFVRSNKRPPEIPASPEKTYAVEGWQGMGDWLGTGDTAPKDREYRSFESARNYVRRLGLRNAEEWRDFAKSPARPADIPASPRGTYLNEGWRGMGDWLGTGRTRATNVMPFHEARAYARALKLSGTREWQRWCASSHRPPEIPSQPWNSYRNDGWQDMSDWLGIPSGYRDFESAREFARSLNFTAYRAWVEFAKTDAKPADIPANPRVHYRSKGWISAGDWLGTGSVAPQLRRYRSFEDARNFVRSLHLKGGDQWRSLVKSGALPQDIPANPNEVYARLGWVSMGDWLGTGVIATQNRSYRPFAEAREFARSLELKNVLGWRAYLRSGSKPADIPAQPHRVYEGNGWSGYADWLRR